jgi:peptidoglycan/xylan/chitin deacetylase (PgdA/CDA1 family)
LSASVTFDDISPSYLTAAELKRLIDFLEEVDIVCTFFVIPYENWCSSSNIEEFTSYLRVASKNGHELALHGYRHVKNEFGCFYPVPLPIPFPPFKKQKEHLEKGLKILANLTSARPLGFRAPFYLHNNATFKALSSLGFHYDSSATLFKPTHSPHLRMRWLHDCKPYIREGVVEIPVIGDYIYSLKGDNFFDLFRVAMRDFEYVKSRHGVFVLNNHPQYLSDVSYRFLRTLFKKLSEKADFLKLCDVAEMYLNNAR